MGVKRVAGFTVVCLFVCCYLLDFTPDCLQTSLGAIIFGGIFIFSIALLSSSSQKLCVDTKNKAVLITGMYFTPLKFMNENVNYGMNECIEQI